MTGLNEMELQNLRHLLLASDTEVQKYSAYADGATDPHVKQYFQKSSQSANQIKQQLVQFLQ